MREDITSSRRGKGFRDDNCTVVGLTARIGSML
jgi:hypothetical protein